ncbi:MAG TPA: EAL domain-containing protein [Pseudolabrys sp.]|nr:EAL domain-containing protein [Pseudolabrys sp.]
MGVGFSAMARKGSAALHGDASPGRPSANPHRHPLTYLLIGAALLIAAIIAGSGFLVANFRERALDDSERELKNTSLILSEQLDRSFQAIELVQHSVIDRVAAGGIATSSDLTAHMGGEDVHAMLQDKTSGLAQVDAIALVNADGLVVNVSRKKWPHGLTVADRDYFRALKADPQRERFVSMPVSNRSNGAWTIFLAHRLTGKNGQFIGIVLGAVELDYFERLFGAIALGRTGTVSLYRDDGTLLVRYPRSASAIGHVFTAALHALGDHTEGSARVFGRINPHQLVIAAHRLEHFPLYVSAAREVDQVLANWWEQTKVLLGAGLLIVLTIIAVMLLVARQLSRNHEWSKRRLALEKHRLAAAVASMPHGLLLFDAEGRLVVCNRSYMDMYGIAAGAVSQGDTLQDVLRVRKGTGTFVEDVDEYCERRFTEIARGVAFETIYPQPDGRAIRIMNHPVEDGGWISLHEDITARRRLEQDRDRDREFLNSIVDNVPTPILVKDVRDRTYVLANKSAIDYIGLPREAVIGKTCGDLWPAEDAARIDRQDTLATQAGGYLFSDEHVLNTPGKGQRIVTSKRLLMRDAEGAPQYMLTVIEDITERKQSEKRIAHLAHHDALTGLPNRVLFREQLEQSLKRVRSHGNRLALLYLDLDRFKGVNDTLGHPVGDELLKEVAQRLRGCVGDADFVARLGGDEFAIVRDDFETPDDITALVTRILVAMSAPYDIGGHNLVTEATIGVALAPEDASDPDELLKNADLAMYGAKSDGRGTYRFFETSMDARMKSRRALEFDLREAIMCGGFELHYQPLVAFADGRVTACEALLRWQHRARGLIPPSEFIPIAEETGLITPLGEWVLRTACVEAAKWPEEIRAAVNVSPVQFNNPGLVQAVIAALAVSGLAPHRLELEITEAVLIRDDAAALGLLHQLRALGVRIALDDFGTGYSSLSYLQRFPFDKIKIDRSFVSAIGDSDYSRNIVQAIVDIATTRQITTTAEGVETEEQSKALRALGCTEMQGYLFSPPVTAAKLAKYLPRPRRRRLARAG